VIAAQAPIVLHRSELLFLSDRASTVWRIEAIISEVLAMSVTAVEELFGAGEARTPAAHAILERLVDAGTSVIVIEHHQAVMAHADWIVDLGPGAGHDGGRIAFEGTSADLVAAHSTLTGEHLAAYVGT
jgi:hypothetical protein